MTRRTRWRGLALAVLLSLAAVAYRAAGTSAPLPVPTGGPGTAAGSGGIEGSIAVAEASKRQVSPLEVAIGQFERALRRHPSDPAPLRQLAAEIASADGRRGVEAFERLASAYPADAPSWAGLARSRYAIRDRGGAGDAAERALRLDPKLPEARLLLGRLLAEGEPPRPEEALAQWRRVVELAPESVEAREAGELIRLYEGR
jgi:tetratricopeptide (TPR) repeat protein